MTTPGNPGSQTSASEISSASERSSRSRDSFPGNKNQSLPEAALAYAELGWKIHPLKPYSKDPDTAHGWQDATDDPDQIRRWWAENPQRNIGLPAGLNDLYVTDVDIKPWKNKTGDQTLAALEAEYDELPKGLVQRTWSGGLQYFFAQPATRLRNSTGTARAGLGHHIDGRGDGGYVVLPPSVVHEDDDHPEAVTEGAYEWIHIEELPDLPQWVPDRLSERRNGRGSPFRTGTPPETSPASAGPQRFRGARERLERLARGIEELAPGDPAEQPCNDAALEMTHHIVTGEISVDEVRARLQAAVDTWEDGHRRGEIGIEHGLRNWQQSEPCQCQAETNVGGRDDDVFPEPRNPMGVARQLLQEYQAEGFSTLVHWRDTWMQWTGPAWTEATNAAVRAWQYEALEHARYVSGTDDQGREQLAQWSPTRSKIEDVLDAMRACGFLVETVETGTYPDGLRLAEQDHVQASPGNVQANVQGSGRIIAGQEALSRQSRQLPTNSPLMRTRDTYTGSTAYTEGDSSPIDAAMGISLDCLDRSEVSPDQNGLSPDQVAWTETGSPGPILAETVFDLPPNRIVSVQNGLLDIETRALYAHTPGFFNTTSVPFAYDPQAAPPAAWLAFLESAWPDDQQAIDALAEWFGYVLSGATDHQKMMLIVGPTRSGKGTISDVLAALVGRANVGSTGPFDLAEGFGLQALLGKTLAIMPDARMASSGMEPAVERLLKITGEDTISVRRKHMTDWVGKLSARFMLLSNELPSFRDASAAIAGRMIILQMTKSFFGREDRTLRQRLLAELPGILNWALDGLERLSRTGRFTHIASSEQAIAALAESVSPIRTFLEQCCSLDDPTATTPRDDLFRAWQVWCEDAGHRAGAKAHFGRQLNAAAPQVGEARPVFDGKRLRVYTGIALTNPLRPASTWTAGRRPA